MVERIVLTMAGAGSLERRPSWNYALIERACAAARRSGVTLLAFGLGGSTLRLVVEGESRACGNLIRGIKVGTIGAARGQGVALFFVETSRAAVGAALEDAVIEAHRTPLEHGATAPLASPWSSHRDLLGYRRASFFDAGPLRARVDPARVHRRLGGVRDAGAPRRPVPPPSLELLLRASAAVRGTVAADPKCYAAFVQAAKARGYATRDIARSLAVTTRRVNQLAHRPDPYLPLVERTIADPRLRRVP